MLAPKAGDETVEQPEAGIVDGIRSCKGCTVGALGSEAGSGAASGLRSGAASGDASGLGSGAASGDASALGSGAASAVGDPNTALESLGGVLM